MPDTYEQIIEEQVERAGRPLHPWFRKALAGEWLDPTAAEVPRPNGGEPIDKRERTLMNATSFYAIEGLYGPLTPLGMIALCDAALTFLATSKEEARELGINTDPWGEIALLPDAAREEFGRMAWHLGRAVEAMTEAGMIPATEEAE
jgi:hypothetical protein